MEENDQIHLITCILHLYRASKLISLYDTEISDLLLQLSKSLIDKFNVKQASIDEIENIENQILNDCHEHK